MTKIIKKDPLFLFWVLETVLIAGVVPVCCTLLDVCVCRAKIMYFAQLFILLYLIFQITCSSEPNGNYLKVISYHISFFIYFTALFLQFLKSFT